jgi:hypothetical protein
MTHVQINRLTIKNPMPNFAVPTWYVCTVGRLYDLSVLIEGLNLKSILLVDISVFIPTAHFYQARVNFLSLHIQSKLMILRTVGGSIFITHVPFVDGLTTTH